jgi:serine/threonine protein kinase
MDSTPQLLSDTGAAAEIPFARQLPAGLRQRLRVLKALPTAGSEADLLVVQVLPGSDERVLKLYRQGIQGDQDLQDQLRLLNCAQVIHVDESGVADGVRFELMEYCPLGDLRSLMERGPFAVERIRDVVAELAQGLSAIHGQRILHRDLKPENVLVRSLQPLSLVLTDFGISSLRLATQHFTSGARTTRYAAPEALTGVLDEKSDWWSLGMLVMEAALGRHPFEGLNEQVINHLLATKPIDTRVVFHDDLRKLCRGLLLRDPHQRWGADEVQRWLRADPTLPLPQESAVSVAIRPYRIEDSSCTNALELAATMVKHWESGAKDLMRGTVAAWIDNELHDHNLLRRLQDIMDRRGLSDDWRLLAFVLVAAPEIPAVWQGQTVSRETLLLAARKSTQGDAKASAWLQSIHAQGVLELLGDAGRQAVLQFRHVWLQGLRDFETHWQTARAAEDAWSRAPPTASGKSGAVDVAYALYVQPIRMNMPSVERLHGQVLLALHLPAYVSTTRMDILKTMAQHLHFCSWFGALGPVESLDPIRTAVAKTLLPLAVEDTQRQAKIGGAPGPQTSADSDETRQAVLVGLKPVLEAARRGLDSPDQIRSLQSALEPLQEICARTVQVVALGNDMATFRNMVESCLAASLQLQGALDDALAVYSINAIWLKPQRLLIGVSIVATTATWTRISLAVALAVMLLAAIGWRMNLRSKAKAAALRKLQSFTRFGDKLIGLYSPKKP